MASIFVDFIYQITFYSAVMAIVGQFEMRAEMRKKSTAYKVSIPIGSVIDIREESKVENNWMSNSNYNQVIQNHRQNVIL